VNKFKKTKVLFVASQLGAGGAERIILDLANGLDPLQFDVYLAAFNRGVLEPAFRRVCKEIIFIEKKQGIDLSAMLKLSNILSQYKIDVVNAHHYMPFFYSLLGTKILHNRKLIYTEHSVPEVEGIYSSIHGKLFRWMLYRVNRVVGVSTEIRDALRKMYPMHTKKFVAILNGVNIDKFSRREQRMNVREQFGFSPEHFVIGTVANFREVKNHACIIRAAARLKEAYPLVRFLFVGTGFPGDLENTENTIRQMIKAFQLEDRVILAGYQDDIPSVLSSLDAFCLSSFSEGLPVSVLEAMAARVPVIGTNVAGIREVIDDGKTGLLFANDNDDELASLIKKLTAGTLFAQKMMDEAYRFIIEKHAYQKFYGRYAALFDS